jgi:hypothetical protein
MAAWKSDCRRSRKRRFTGVRIRLRSQAVAPLATAVLDQSYAALGGHAAEKAVHSPAVALLGLIGSLDGEIPCCLEPNGTAVVYPTLASRSMIPLVSLHPSASGLAAPTGLCYNPGPEAGWIGSTEPTQYKSHKPDSYMSPPGCQLRSQHRFPISEQTGWGISSGSAPPTCGNPVRSFPQAPTIRSPVQRGFD